MRLDWLKPLTELEGPFASVTLDASNLDPVSREHLAQAWSGARRTLERDGASEDTLAALEEAVTADNDGSGERTHVLCAADGHVVLDVRTPGRPAREQAGLGPVPSIMAAVQALDGLPGHAVVRLDRQGADIEVLDSAKDVVTSTQVSGADDELRKVAPGGSSQRRFQARAEDSWKHNATQVAEELDRITRSHDLAVIFVEGDDHMVSHLRSQASGAVADLLLHLETGGRAAGTSGEAEVTAREAALARQRVERDAALVERYGDASGAGRAVEGWAAVTGAVERAQADHVLVDSRVAAAPEVDGLLFSLAATGAELSVISQPFEPLEGIGAILRWNDESTEH